MKNQFEFDNSIIRSGTRVRESVRSLPEGHFQQIKQMFDKQSCSTKNLPTIYERQQKAILSDVLLRLPVSDDEKLKHTTAKIASVKINSENEKTLGERYRDYLSEYQRFRLKLTNELVTHKTMYSSEHGEQSPKDSMLLPHENQLNQGIVFS